MVSVAFVGGGCMQYSDITSSILYPVVRSFRPFMVLRAVH